MVGTVAKVGIGAALIVGLYLLIEKGKQAVSQVASQFGFQIVGYGTPGVDGFNVTLPVIVRFNNPTSIPANIDNVKAIISVNKNGVLTPAAQINQQLSIPPGVSDQKITAKVDLKSVFGGSVLNTALTILNAAQSKSVQFQTIVYVTYSGFTLPPQNFTQDIKIG